MFQKLQKNNILLFISAIVSAFVFMKMNVFLIFFSWSPFLYVIYLQSSSKKAFYKGFLFGITYGFCLFNWTINALNNYSTLAIYTYLVPVVLSIFYAILFGCFAMVVFKLYNKNTTNYYVNLAKKIAIASFIALFDELFSFIFQGIPFLNLRVCYVLSKSVYLSQLASIGGFLILSFIVAITNVLVSFYLLKRNKKVLIEITLPISLSFILGFIIFKSYSPNINNKLNVCVASGNIDPKTSWSETTGNALASNYFELEENASSTNPDFIIWPESVFPWIYNEKDDLLNELLKINPNKKTIQVFGLNSKKNTESNEISNSALFLNGENKNEGTYYKNISLEGFEKPLLNFFQIPFAYSEHVIYKNVGNSKPVTTSKGKIGVLICNESMEERLITKQVKNGAQNFFVLSNDGWFKNTYISEHHFYITRIVAIAFRKDFAISSNCGYNGFFSSTGNIIKSEKSDNPLTVNNIIYKNDTSTFFINFPNLFPITFLLIIILYLLVTFKFKQL